ncbi:hypothetical protein CYMTET_14480 [Cymbomonas tetramitiformis]|uniref:RING-type domain-containing protein n=1 Tax=Cymbomonas tetramitiformis TaxID=36881 RepID=A0AAE0L9V8_9CHLO|nr:hypothetical protein CYMTET_14480 [Cymbomonas tetramitiformis]
MGRSGAVIPLRSKGVRERAVRLGCPLLSYQTSSDCRNTVHKERDVCASEGMESANPYADFGVTGTSFWCSMALATFAFLMYAYKRLCNNSDHLQQPECDGGAPSLAEVRRRQQKQMQDKVKQAKAEPALGNAAVTTSARTQRSVAAAPRRRITAVSSTSAVAIREDAAGDSIGSTGGDLLPVFTCLNCDDPLQGLVGTGVARCSEGHMFCASCVTQLVVHSPSPYVPSDQLLRLACFYTESSCPGHLPLPTLAGVVPPLVLDQFHQRAQAMELARAGVRGLEQCASCGLRVEDDCRGRVLQMTAEAGSADDRRGRVLQMTAKAGSCR